MFINMLQDTYVRMLFIDFSSAFNTIIPQHLIGKLNLLGLNTSLSNWILDFLTGRPQSVRIGRNTSSTTTLSTGAPQGCVLSPLLFTLLTHDCAAMHSSNHIIKFADDTTVVGLISKNDESAYREEVQRLTDWCRTNNLSLNVDKTKEMVVDFRRTRRDHSPLHIDGSTVEIVKSTKFLGVHLAEDLTWSLNTSTITKKAQQRLYFLRRLRKAHLPPPILTTFYRGTIESILSSCITAWFGNCTVSDRKSLQRVVRTAEKIIGVSLPTITDIYTTRCIRKANSIVDDHTHPSHTLFTLLPSGKRSRPSIIISSSGSLPDDLNAFYTRFETPTPTTPTDYTHTSTTRPPSPSPVVSSAQVHKALRRINPRKATGPDNIPGRALRACANELADVFTSIFNLSLRQCTVPTCYKTTTVVPLPKKNPPSCLNDYRPVALTPIIMKCFERVVLSHIQSSILNTTDPLQYAYRSNRSTSDAIAAALHVSLSHLENKDSYVRILFIDYSSAFNTVVPHRLTPILYTLFTHDCVATHPGNIILKFADDTAVIGRITGGDEAAYRKEVDSLVAWCTKNNLTLNTDKTKEMIVDMRKERRPHQPLFIRDLEVERVSSFKYLGVHISDDLTWTLNTTYVLKRAQQRLYFLRRLRKFGMSHRILSNFYSCIIESILTSCITVWYGSTTLKDRKRLQRVVKTATKITKMAQPSLHSIYNLRVHRRAASIIKDPTHPQHGLFTLLPSGRRHCYTTGINQITPLTMSYERRYAVSACYGNQPPRSRSRLKPALKRGSTGSGARDYRVRTRLTSKPARPSLLSAGPDNIPTRVLRECADQLTDVNFSLSSATVPTCLKAATIIPVPKKSSVSCLNDYRLVALTPIIMKCFERLVMKHIKTLLPPSLDPLQFAYRPNRSTDNAISTTLHVALTHLDNRDTYVGMLFIDFSSAFNTIIPQHLIEKLNLLGLNTSLSNWILDFLTGRPQSVWTG
ncbi:hypothetical protein NFI96_000064 [Prochilodus magdalenae]|nr:hypothetical protein NFI96_000064 [Prochilodus magdalenae]